MTENKTFEPNKVLMGAPARAIRTMDEKVAAKMPRAADHYVWNKQRFLDKLEKIEREEAQIRNIDETSAK